VTGGDDLAALRYFPPHAVILRSEATKNLSVSWFSVEERFFAEFIPAPLPGLRMTIQESFSTN